MAHNDSKVDFGFEADIEKATAILRAISHPLRLKILNLEFLILNDIKNELRNYNT